MWLILRTDHGKEQYVARRVANMGHQAWVPSQIIVCRPTVARKVTAKAHLAKIKELPILPRRVFVDVEFGIGRDWPNIRHMDGIEVYPDGGLLTIPDAQVQRFRAAIDAENTASLALHQKASRKQKARWKSLHDALVEMIQGAKETMEQAA